MRIAAALGIFVAVATAVCPLRICFDDDGGAPAPAVPGDHGHEDHDGPDRDSGGCCVDVPKETGGPWVVVHLDLPAVSLTGPDSGPRTPLSPAPENAPRAESLRSKVLLR